MDIVKEREMEDGAIVHTCRLGARMLGALVGVAIDRRNGW